MPYPPKNFSHIEKFLKDRKKTFFKKFSCTRTFLHFVPPRTSFLLASLPDRYYKIVRAANYALANARDSAEIHANLVGTGRAFHIRLAAFHNEDISTAAKLISRVYIKRIGSYLLTADGYRHACTLFRAGLKNEQGGKPRNQKSKHE